MPQNNKAIQKYLKHYAEPGTDLIGVLPLLPGAVYQQAIVIPAFNESGQFIDRLQNLHPHEHSLFIIVLNGPENRTGDDIKSTLAPLRHLRSTQDPGLISKASYQTDLQIYFYQQPTHDFLFIDLISQTPGNQSHSGVGFARKLGMDCCLWLYFRQRLLDPFVRNTDADVSWPPDYLQSIAKPTRENQQASALLYPFRHKAVEVDDTDECQAAALYDCWLRYYVAGLHWAQSPWAFHTVGSTLVIHLQHYAVHRGFPKRQAGEDFYLLNKLAKSGDIIQLRKPVLELSNRSSDRTPFGTGKSINSIKLNSQESWQFYHPDIFGQLRYWNQRIPALYADIKRNADGNDKSDLKPELPPFPPEFAPMQAALTTLNINKRLQHCVKQSGDENTFLRHMNNGFDAAATRKCVHWLRDHYYPGLSFQSLCKQVNEGSLPFIPAPASKVVSTTGLSRYLQQLESE